MKSIEQLQKELEELLESRPEFREFQEKINDDLKKCTTFNEKMEYFKFRFEENLQKLEKLWCDVSNEAKKIEKLAKEMQIND